jgi:aryl-alcohol dehydrogenase (NADP+)
MNRQLPATELNVFPLCLGGNVFGWTADEQQSFDVLDRYAAAGGNFIDTADAYSAWVPGHAGGESETIIGKWMNSRRNRASIVVATKVGRLQTLKGLSAATIAKGAEDSLRRLGTDYIDLYYAHADDPAAPLEESLRAFDTLVRDGKVRYVAASNYSAPRLAEALELSRREGLARYVALQPHYNLVHRGEFEGELRDLCEREHLACFPYYALASGFLTGKYRSGNVDSVRAASARKYADDVGTRVLTAVETVAAAHGTSMAAVALAWLMAQPTVVAPIASARTGTQLQDLLPAVTLRLSPAELGTLSAA